MLNDPKAYEEVMGGLKDFQKRTVAHVYDRLFVCPEKRSRRFLVADEVGLGKTIVARGVIARCLQNMNQEGRVDVLYICSNAAIANHNIHKLKIKGIDVNATATRLTLLAEQKESMSRGVNFISMTPNTAFKHHASQGGQAHERAVIFTMLKRLTDQVEPSSALSAEGLKNMLRHSVRSEASWDGRLKYVEDGKEKLNEEISQAFCKKVQENTELWDDLVAVCSAAATPNASEIIAKLRSTLASISMELLKPSLIILDEFQRFKDLLNPSDENTKTLMSALWGAKDAAILLLSATPYKMLSLSGDDDDDDAHYADFIETLKFLFNDSCKTQQAQALLKQHRLSLQNQGSNEAKKGIQKLLLEVMCRTERIDMTRERDAMLEEKLCAGLLPDAAEIRQIACVDALSQVLQAGNAITFWKSIPYLFSYLGDYQLDKKMKHAMESPSDELLALMRAAYEAGCWVPKASIQNYEKLPMGHAKMRYLREKHSDSWKLLWMPPSLPYVTPEGCFENQEHLTKDLIFSRWKAVPDAIATLGSYHVEQKMVQGSAYGRSYDQEARPRLLTFAQSKSGKPSTMRLLAWMMPWPTLASDKSLDPLCLASRQGAPLSQKEIRATLKPSIQDSLNKIKKTEAQQPKDDRWYWAAPLLLEKENNHFLDWLKKQVVVCVHHSEGDARTYFQSHIKHAVQWLESDAHHSELGGQPEDLAEVLTELVLAAPGICALRALQRRVSTGSESPDSLWSAALDVAEGFRTLYNRPENMALLNQLNKEEPRAAYWRQTLAYGIEGNLQAMLDEHVHMLRGMVGGDVGEQSKAIGAHVRASMSLKSASLQVNTYEHQSSEIRMASVRLRCLFALRLSDHKQEDNSVARSNAVLEAFNSPFRPFVLASTSVGQEGLDFHTWCHAVTHWDLPSNPVDFEQREGRVHRFKGHAIRKNIAKHLGLKALDSNSVDPWAHLFAAATPNKKNTDSDLVPYWLYEEGRNPSKIERHVPLFLGSKEEESLGRLKRNLTLYRLAFGQPRQEDLLHHLNTLNDEEVDEALQNRMISLRPKETS